MLGFWQKLVALSPCDRTGKAELLTGEEYILGCDWNPWCARV